MHFVALVFRICFCICFCISICICTCNCTRSEASPSLSSSVVNPCVVKEEECNVQPSDLIDILESVGLNASNPCLFRKLLSPDKCLHFKSSVLEVWEAAAVPDASSWSRCQHCMLDLTTYRWKVWGPDVREKRSISLSRSNWGEFFHGSYADQSIADLLIDPPILDSMKSDTVYIDRPVFVVPLLTVHPGHVMIELLEQVHGAMLATYGRIRKDIILLLDVAGQDENSVLPVKLKILASGHKMQSDSYAALLSALADLPVLPTSLLHNAHTLGVHNIIFADIHLGLNGAAGHFQGGYLSHGYRSSSGVVGHSPYLGQLTSDIARTFLIHQKSSQAMRTRLALLVNRGPPLRPPLQSSDTSNVDYAATRQSRDITNFDELLQITKYELCAEESVEIRLGKPRPIHCEKHSPLNWEVRGIDLDTTPHSEQRALLARTDLLVAVAGTALHNTILMQPPAAVMAIMQPNWCSWAWMYTRQARLLGLSARELCVSSYKLSHIVHGRTFFQWSRHFWQQGPRQTKDMNIKVDAKEFAITLNALIGDLSRDQANSEIEFSTVGEGTLKADTSAASPRKMREKQHSTKIPPPGLLGEVYVTSVDATEVVVAAGKSSKWQLVIRGELAIPSGLFALSSPLITMPHLSICMYIVESGASPWCSQLENMNYYSDLRLVVASPELVIKIWLQASPIGGRLLNSEALVTIDARKKNSGILTEKFSKNMKGVNVAVWVDLDQKEVRVGAGHLSGATAYLRLSTGLALQRQVPNVCDAHHIPDYICAEVAAAVLQYIHRRLLGTSLGLPDVQDLPTPHQPFVFLHIEKTAGTSLREQVVRAAEHHDLRYFVPCHGDSSLIVRTYIDCTVLSPADVYRYGNGSQVLLRNVSVLAGHFSWGFWEQLPRLKLAHVAADVHSSLAPSCLVMARHPVDRAVSYYYQRCYNTQHCRGYQQKINSLSPDDLLHVMRFHRHGLVDPFNTSQLVVLDEGMMDAACRAMAGEKRTSGLRLPLNDARIPLPDPVDLSVRTRALHNANQCVIGMQEFWETSAAHVNHFFPWMKTAAFPQDLQPPPRKMQLFVGQEDRKTLRQELIAIIEKYNTCDMELYAQMRARFELQKQVVVAEK